MNLTLTNFILQLQSYYPERLGKVFLINVPYIFMQVWKVIYQFLDAKTKEKVDFSNIDRHNFFLLKTIYASEKTRTEPLSGEVWTDLLVLSWSCAVYLCGQQGAERHTISRYRWEPTPWEVWRKVVDGANWRIHRITHDAHPGYYSCEYLKTTNFWGDIVIGKCHLWTL